MVSLFQPIGMTIASNAPHKWSRDVPIIAEATALTLSVNAFVKHLTHRSRPAAHFCESERAVVPCPPDTRLSFYSGHTSSAFAAAVAAGTIADFHHYENRKWIWASGLTFATATGVLRVMADQHYATDVLTGMAAGGLAGWLIPKLHKPDPTAPPAQVFYHGPAPGVGCLTIAANTLEWIDEPLDQKWLQRARRSTSAEPLREPVYRQARLSLETWEILLEHPQFRK